MSEQEKTWYFIDERGNVAGFAYEPHINRSEQHLKKVYLIDPLFSRKEVHDAMTEEDMGLARYHCIPADHKIAKYVVEHGVEVK